jgi:hypothetical protein
MTTSARGELSAERLSRPRPTSECLAHRGSSLREGGAVWVTGTYDPVTNQTLWGTGNPVHRELNGLQAFPRELLWLKYTIPAPGELGWCRGCRPADRTDRTPCAARVPVNRGSNHKSQLTIWCP